MPAAPAPASVTCPTCSGRKRGLVHLNRGDKPHEFREMDCRTCAGTGAVSAEVALRIAKGEALRQARIARGEGLREAARRLGITAAELSAREQGAAS